MKSFTILLIVLLAVIAPIYGMQEKKSLAEWWAVVEAAQDKKTIPAFSTQLDKSLYSVESPLHWAAVCGDTELVTALITVVKIPVDIRNGNSATALHKAARSLNVATVRALIKAHAGVNAVDDNGATPLHWLLKRVDKEVIEIMNILLDEGHAHVNVQDAFGWTPLHCAVQKMNKDIIRLLIEHDADLKVMNSDKHSPLHTENASLQGEILGIVLEVEQRKKIEAQAAKPQKGIGEFVKCSHILTAQAKKILADRKEEKKQEATPSVVQPVVVPVMVAPIPVKTIVLTEQAPSPAASQTEVDLSVTAQPSLLQKLPAFEEAVAAMVDDIVRVYEPARVHSEESKEEKPKSSDAIRESIMSSLRSSVEAIDADKLMRLVWDKNLAAVYHYYHDMRDEVNTHVCNLLARYAALKLGHQTNQIASASTMSNSVRALYTSTLKLNETHFAVNSGISPRNKDTSPEEVLKSFVMVDQSSM